MKNQNDLIIIIVSAVLALIIAGVCIGTKREPNTIPAPEKVILTAPALPAGDVVMVNSLPGGGNSTPGGPGAGGPRTSFSGGGPGAPSIGPSSMGK